MTLDLTTRPQPAGRDGAQPIFELVRDHLGVDPTTVPMLSERFQFWEELNVQAGLDAYGAEPGRSTRLVGVATPPPAGSMGLVFRTPVLAGLLSKPDTRVGAVEYVRCADGPDEYTTCVRTGLYLFDGPSGPVVAWLREEGRHPQGVKSLDVLAPSMAQAQAFLDELRRHMAEHNRFRGRYLRLSVDAAHNVQVDFEPRPHVERDEVILPPGVLEAVERHAIGVTERADRLVASGRHLKRGLLLYGPPGTGKTHIIRYLASRLPQSTLFVLTGSGMAWLDFVKDIVPHVAPAIVVLDDVDLIAEDRDLAGMAPRSLLFSLLDAMDGIREDSDVLFVCTSNRADTLERAIAARPGRIDQSVEVGLPDADGRRRLLALYADGLDLRLDDPEAVIERTEGVTASFMKELLRRSWLVAQAAGSAAVLDQHVHAALDALLDPANPLTPALLGVTADTVGRQGKQRGAGQAWCGI